MTDQCPKCGYELQGWEVVEQEIGRSTIERHDWRRVFGGQTLTKKISEQYALGYSSDKAFQNLLNELRSKARATPENIRKLRIGVNARYGEIRSESRRIEEVKGNAQMLNV